MLILQDISYIHPNKDLLFDTINLAVNNHDKLALIGNNGVGKSTLLKIIAGEVQPSGGHVKAAADSYYIPQIFGQYNHLTVAQALRIEQKLHALTEILKGSVTESHLALLNDDWTIEDRCREVLAYWQLTDVSLNQTLDTLSGGQKTKIFLAGIFIHQPALVLLDEPSNHLDVAGRQLLYDFIQSTTCTLMVVSHDRTLLNLLNPICELTRHGIKTYGGNYNFYKSQRQLENHALSHHIQSREKALRKAKEKERETAQRQQKLNSRGKGKQEKAGMPKGMMNKMKNDSENSTSRLSQAHAEKISSISQDLYTLRSSLPGADKMKFGLHASALHTGKILISAKDINIQYRDRTRWKQTLNLQITSGERIALKGPNGSGKSTLLRLITGGMEPQTGTLYRALHKSVYIDQDYSLLDTRITVYEQAQRFNTLRLAEHEIRIRLNRFLFTKEHWDKSCSVLSGGERMRLTLCVLTLHSEQDMIVLDEPTNNLDIQNIEILTKAIKEYPGTLLVVSHDAAFLEQITITRTIELQGPLPI